MEKFFSQLSSGRLGLTEIFLLTELYQNGPGYGINLIERVQRRTGILLKQGSVYPILDQMKEANLLKAETLSSRLPQGGGRPPILYSLTETGRNLTGRLIGALGNLFKP